MAIVVVKPGKLPVPPKLIVLVGVCRKCKCEFKCDPADTIMGAIHSYVYCPTEGCIEKVTVGRML
jgi:hypothetical protein